jgi:phospholipase/carboxylesterase
VPGAPGPPTRFARGIHARHAAPPSCPSAAPDGGLTPLRGLRLGGLDARLTGGTDGHGGGDGPLVVLLHGFGAPGDDLVPFGSAVRAPAGTRFLFPAAPVRMVEPSFEGRAWWMIDFARREQLLAGKDLETLADETPEGLAEARAALVALLDEAAATLGAPPERTVLGGFSQGAMLALDTALRDRRPLAGLVLLSPTLIAAVAWGDLAPARAGLPVFLSHGRRDPLLPFFMTERVRELLKGAGVAVTWVPFDGGHEVPAVAVTGMSDFLATVLGGA